MDCSLPASSVHAILQARILEWVAILSPEYLPDQGIEPRTPTLLAFSLPSEPPGKPRLHQYKKINKEREYEVIHEKENSYRGKPQKFPV